MRPSSELTYFAGSVGSHAVVELGRSDSGKVEAVFGSTMYVRTTNSLICIGGENVDEGPSIIRLMEGYEVPFRQMGVEDTDPWMLRRSDIVIADRIVVRMERARVWNPPKLDLDADPVAVRKSLETLRRMDFSEAPDDGLGAFIRREFQYDKGTASQRLAGRFIDDARRTIECHGTASVPTKSAYRWSRRLIGLGPGLTPSGDDFVVGFMLAARYFGLGRVVDMIWANVSGIIGNRTNKVSGMFLESASTGLGNRSSFEVISAMKQGDEIRLMKSVRRLTSFGHTSGWDLLAGIALAAEARTHVCHPG